MSYTNYDFPHTHYYDSDLRELIRMYNEVTSDYSNLVKWMEEHKAEYDELNNKVNQLQSKLDSIIADIDAEFEKLKNELSEEIFIQINELKTEVINQLTDMSNRLLEMQKELTDAINEQIGIIEGYNDYLRRYVDAKLEEFIESFPDLHTVYVYNPIKGYQTDIQTAVNDLYDLGRSYGLTASEYDSMGITANEYDALALTAIEYDQYGRDYLERAGLIKNPFHYMSSPFTGKYVPLEVVINELAALHKDDSLTATEYDALELTADYYDSLELSAYDYDWHSKTLVA